MQEHFSRFKARYILLDLIIIFVTLVILVIVASLVTKLNPESLKNPFAASIVNYLFIIALCLSIIRRLKKNDIQIKSIIGNTSFRDFPWLMLSIIFYGILTLNQGVAQLTIFFGYKIAPDLVISAIKSTSSQYSYETNSLPLKIMFNIVLFVSIVIVAPLSEEFVFRGVLFHRFAAKWGATAAIVLSSLIFGLLHMNIYAISLGVSFIFVTLTYIKTKALIVPIAFHVMNNAVAMMSLILHQTIPSSGAVEITLRTLWSGLLDTAFALPILFYFLKWPSNSDLVPYTANFEAANPQKPKFNQVDKTLGSD